METGDRIQRRVHPHARNLSLQGSIEVRQQASSSSQRAANCTLWHSVASPRQDFRRRLTSQTFVDVDRHLTLGRMHGFVSACTLLFPFSCHISRVCQSSPCVASLWSRYALSRWWEALAAASPRSWPPLLRYLTCPTLTQTTRAGTCTADRLRTGRSRRRKEINRSLQI